MQSIAYALGYLLIGSMTFGLIYMITQVLPR